MSDPTFMADPTRLVIAAIVGIALLLALIIKFKLHPVLSMMVSALVIGIGAGMPLDISPVWLSAPRCSLRPAWSF